MNLINPAIFSNLIRNGIEPIKVLYEMSCHKLFSYVLYDFLPNKISPE